MVQKFRQFIASVQAVPVGGHVLFALVLILIVSTAIVFGTWISNSTQTRIEKSTEPLACLSHCRAPISFTDAIEYLQQQGVAIPILVPTVLPHDLENVEIHVQISTSPKQTITSSSYALAIYGNPSDCLNWAGGGCFIGVITANDDRLSSTQGIPVTLAEGTQGIFESFADGGTLSWNENGIAYTYSFGFSYPEETIVAMANSAIQAGGHWVCAAYSPYCVSQRD